MIYKSKYGRELIEKLKALTLLGHNLAVDSHAGGVKITTKNGDRDLSPRGTPKEILTWLEGYIAACSNSARLRVELKDQNGKHDEKLHAQIQIINDVLEINVDGFGAHKDSVNNWIVALANYNGVPTLHYRPDITFRTYQTVGLPYAHEKYRG